MKVHMKLDSAQCSRVKVKFLVFPKTVQAIYCYRRYGIAIALET